LQAEVDAHQDDIDEVQRQIDEHQDDIDNAIDEANAILNGDDDEE